MAFQPNLPIIGTVIVGRWNPAILQPAWLSKHVFGVEKPGELQFVTEFSIETFGPPRFSANGLQFVSTFERLSISPNSIEPEKLKATEDAARKILDALQHTPVQAVGVNFEFYDDAPSRGFLRLFDDLDHLAENTGIDLRTQATALTYSMSLKDCILNLTREFAVSGRVSIKFNFHYVVNSAREASSRLLGAGEAHWVTVQKILAAYTEIGSTKVEGLNG
jgi:hypothetical protein